MTIINLLEEKAPSDVPLRHVWLAAIIKVLSQGSLARTCWFVPSTNTTHDRDATMTVMM